MFGWFKRAPKKQVSEVPEAHRKLHVFLRKCEMLAEHLCEVDPEGARCIAIHGLDGSILYNVDIIHQDNVIVQVIPGGPGQRMKIIAYATGETK